MRNVVSKLVAPVLSPPGSSVKLRPPCGALFSCSVLGRYSDLVLIKTVHLSRFECLLWKIIGGVLEVQFL